VGSGWPADQGAGGGAMSLDVPLATPGEAYDRSEGALVEVRKDDEWQAGHAPDAVHVPMHQLTPDTVPTGCPVYCICRSGNRSGRVAALLVASRIDAYNVVGGMVPCTALDCRWSPDRQGACAVAAILTSTRRFGSGAPASSRPPLPSTGGARQQESDDDR
jgi:rhodanese-related sulfurtransferase